MTQIPNYVLYGEKETELFTSYLHIESIKARSRYHDWKFRAHQHQNLHQFFYIEKGGGGYAIIEGEKYPINDNLLIGIPSLTVHGFVFVPETKGWVLTIPDQYLQTILKDDLLLLEHIGQKIMFQCEDSLEQREFQDIFGSIEKEHEDMAVAYGLTLRCLATLLMTKIVRCQPAVDNVPKVATSQKQILLQRFRRLINMKFKKRLLVAEYAMELHITPTHLNRICRTILNISASELINQRSLLEAKRLLIYTSVTIAEISYELGFCDPAHFSNFFHNKTTDKPSDFRKNFLKQI
ncbi:MAG: helix-turn-helix domain-containing protein [Emcibacter sp.]|nr:helix-turn-helix domain-containing protein [Emcibacter sp.]